MPYFHFSEIYIITMASLNIRNILLLDGIHNICRELLEKAGFTVTVKGKQTEEELVNEIGVSRPKFCGRLC